MAKQKDIVIRRPRREETEEINAFFKLVLEDTFEQNGYQDLKELLEEEIITKRNCLNQDFETKGADRFFLLAELHGRIIGTMEYGSPNELLNQCTNYEMQDLYEIGTVFVHPDYQRKGIVTLLFRELFGILKDQGISEVCFDSGYRIAQTIWCKKFGQPAYFIENHWGEGAHHMVWRIDVNPGYADDMHVTKVKE